MKFKNRTLWITLKPLIEFNQMLDLPDKQLLELINKEEKLTKRDLTKKEALMLLKRKLLNKERLILANGSQM